MPEYCYRTDGGFCFDLRFPMGRAVKCAVVRIGKRLLYGYRDFTAELTTRSNVRHGPGCRGWPLSSEALGVGTDPAAIKRAEAHSRKIGEPTHFCPETGNAILQNRKHRNRYMEKCGFKDRDGGYGDYTGG